MNEIQKISKSIQAKIFQLSSRVIRRPTERQQANKDWERSTIL